MSSEFAAAVRAQANVSRNMDDEQLLAVKKNNGVVQIVGLAGFVKTDPPERGPALTKLRNEFGMRGGGEGAGRGAAAAPPPCPVENAAAAPAPRGGRGNRGNTELDQLTPQKRADYQKQLAEIDTKWPAAKRATVKDYVDHIDY